MRSPRSRIGLAAAGIGLGIGAWMMHDGTQISAPPQPAAADALRQPTASVTPTPTPTAAAPSEVALPVSLPTRVRIPEIKVNAPLTGLSLDASHNLQAPPVGDPNLAGWYQDGTTPGSPGTAIVAGHVDTKRGPAVFYNLGALHKGDTIHIDRQDHQTAVFAIDAIQVYAKDAFPSKTVYGDTGSPELRLITCGGGYNKSTGYLGNVVVFAHLIGTAPEGQ